MRCPHHFFTGFAATFVGIGSAQMAYAPIILAFVENGGGSGIRTHDSAKPFHTLPVISKISLNAGSRVSM